VVCRAGTFSHRMVPLCTFLGKMGDNLFCSQRPLPKVTKSFSFLEGGGVCLAFLTTQPLTPFFPPPRLREVICNLPRFSFSLFCVITRITNQLNVWFGHPQLSYPRSDKLETTNLLLFLSIKPLFSFPFFSACLRTRPPAIQVGPTRGVVSFFRG